MVSDAPTRSTPAPMAVRIRAVMSTSPTSGTLVMVLGPRAEDGRDHVLRHRIFRSSHLHLTTKGARWFDQPCVRHARQASGRLVRLRSYRRSSRPPARRDRPRVGRRSRIVCTSTSGNQVLLNRTGPGSGPVPTVVNPGLTLTAAPTGAGLTAAGPGITVPGRSTPTTAPGSVITITGGPNATANIPGPHNDAADFYGIAVALIAIMAAIALTRIVFGRRPRGGRPRLVHRAHRLGRPGRPVRPTPPRRPGPARPPGRVRRGRGPDGQGTAIRDPWCRRGFDQAGHRSAAPCHS